MADQKSKKSWPGVLFGMIFVLCGLGAAYGSAGKMLVGYIGSNNWQEVPATIHETELVRNYGDTTTYSVKSTYSYTYNGVVFHSNRVSLSTGSDNIGSYWQDLQRSLMAQKRSNEAFALVDPNDPSKSLLDRTLRWKSVIFGLVFLILFVGAGSFVVWISLSENKSREGRLQHDSEHGISSNERTGSWILGAFGGVFFVMGAGMSAVIIPDAIRQGEYFALFLLLFAIVGAAIIYSAFKINRAYRRFGPTPLFLDPVLPGVGGQLGGRFSITLPDNGHLGGTVPQLQARLICTRKRKSGKSTSRSIKWHEQAPVYVKETTNGIRGTFLFDVPISCTPSKEWSGGSSIEWCVTVEGEFSTTGPGKFERTWSVTVEDIAAQASTDLNIPNSFLQKAKLKTDDRIKASALTQVPVTEDPQYISVHSKAGRHMGGKILGVLFGSAFAGVGVFTVLQSWWPGYLFLLIGSLIAILSIYSMGKSIVVKIDKNARKLYTRVSWCGFACSHQWGDVIDPGQFKARKTSTTSSHNRVTEYYAVEFKSDDKKITIADGMEGRKEAQVLIDSIVDRCFPEEILDVAA